MTRIGLILGAAALPVVALAYETAPAAPDALGDTAVVTQPSASKTDDSAEKTVASDCSGNTITIVNTGTRIATGGGNAGGVTINGASIEADGKTVTCGASPSPTASPQ